MYFKNLSLTKIFFIAVFILVLFSALILGITWVIDKIFSFKKESNLIKEYYIQNKKELIQNEVNNVYDYIYYNRNNVKKRLKKNIKNRVYEAVDIAENIYNKNKGIKSNFEIKNMIKDALRPIRFNNGRGYYFATDLTGIEELFADRPEFEGKNLINMKDINGKFVIKDMIEITKTKNEGFYEYTWTKPDSEGDYHKKIAFIKYFKPFNWFIGTGEYLEDVEKDIKNEILDRIENIRYENNRYIFAGDYKGNILTKPHKNKKFINIKDSNGEETVKKLIIKAKENGGFVYHTSFNNDKNPLPAISYSKSIKEWEWYISTGIYIHEIDDLINLNKKKLFMKTSLQLLSFIIIFIIIVVIILLFSYLFSYKILQREVDIFISFFKNSALNNKKITINKLLINEFKIIGEYANEMIDNKIIADKSLIESKNNISSILEASPDGIAVIDTKGNYIECNEELYKLFGFSTKKEIFKINAFSQIAAVDKEKAEENLKKTLEYGRTKKSEEYIFLKKNGKKFNAEITARIIKSSNGNPDKIITIIKNISDRIKKEKERELIINKLEQKQEELRRFTYTVSHDLKSPLITIEGFMGLLKKDIKESKKNKINNDILHVNNAVKKMSSLLDDLLELSRVGRLKNPKITLDLNEVLNDTIKLIKGQIDKHNVEISIKNNLPKILGNKKRMLEVFQNLIENSVKYMGDQNKPKIEIGSINKKNTTLIYIKDNGIGIDKKYHNIIFDLFKKLNPESEGTGIGLTLVKKIINDHSGKIWIESDKKNKGTIFYINFPKLKKARK